MKTRVLVTIRGIVQGVSFRWYTRQTAERLGVNGWVTNLPDGRVQGCFEGEDEAVRELVEWCRNGPPAARVDGVDIVREEFRNEFDSFRVRR